MASMHMSNALQGMPRIATAAFLQSVVHWFCDQGWVSSTNCPRCTIQPTSLSMVLPEEPLRKLIRASPSGIQPTVDVVSFTTVKPFEEFKIETTDADIRFGQLVISWMEAALEVYGYSVSCKNIKNALVYHFILLS